MGNMEKWLEKEKKRMERIQAPDMLEARWQAALERTVPQQRKRSNRSWIIAASLLLIFILLGNQYNAISYYGKKLLGFDGMMNRTLKELNELGYGQSIGKRITLTDGSEVTLDGVMADENQLILYYTIANPEGLNEETFNQFHPSRITGLWTNSYPGYGTASLNETNTELKGLLTFEPVSPFAKTLTLHYDETDSLGQTKEGNVTFSFNPNLAMQTQLKQSINKTVEVDGGTITFSSITATPTTTLIEGKIRVADFDKVPLNGIRLLANGQPIDLQVSGQQSGLGGRTFELQFDALPESLTSLELEVDTFPGYEHLDAQIQFDALDDTTVPIGQRHLQIQNVTWNEEQTEVTIATEEDVLLDEVAIELSGMVIPLKTTVNTDYVKQPDGSVWKKRTLVFDKPLQPDTLNIKGMYYTKTYQLKIDIPLD